MKSYDVHVTNIARPQSGANETKLQLFTSQPQAGFPAPGDDQVERILDINDLVVKHPASTFFVRVSGDSMEGAGIFDNDVLVVDRSIDTTFGQIVVAAINGELVVKRLERGTDGRLVLVSENTKYAPLLVGEDEDCHVWGVVVGSVRQF
jgi:DNA polymerase V